MNIRIDFYTGTGGTQMVARNIADHLRSQGCEVTLHRIVRDAFLPLNPEVDYYVLVFAVHSFCAPRPVLEWAGQLQGNGKPCAVVSVSGGGNVLSNTACRRKTIAKLEKQNFAVVFDEMVRMPNNWMSVPKQEKFRSILSKMPQKSVGIAQAIVEGKRMRKFFFWIDILISALGEQEHAYVEKFGKGIRVLDSCTGCGWCAGRCCSSNITIADGKAVIGDRCDMCLGCIYGCPEQALLATAGAFQVDKKGYDLRKMESRT